MAPAGPGLQPFVHDEGINVAHGWVAESLRQAANELEAQLLPEPDGTLVAGCYEIELHGLVAEALRDFLGVFAH